MQSACEPFTGRKIQYIIKHLVHYYINKPSHEANHTQISDSSQIELTENHMEKKEQLKLKEAADFQTDGHKLKPSPVYQHKEYVSPIPKAIETTIYGAVS